MLNLDDLRRRFGNATLARQGIDQQDAAGGIIAGPPPVTVMQVRRDMVVGPSPEEGVAMGLFGPLSTHV